MSDWIKCSERLPEYPKHASFLAYDSVFGVHIQHGHRRYFGSDKLYNDHTWEITHWMPLPEAPVEDRNVQPANTSVIEMQPI